MANKTTYICEVTQNQLEITWETGLINLHITQPDGSYLGDVSLNKFDIDTMFEEIGIYISAIEKEEKDLEK
jgi:hypothetical protein